MMSWADASTNTPAFFTPSGRQSGLARSGRSPDCDGIMLMKRGDGG